MEKKLAVGRRTNPSLGKVDFLAESSLRKFFLKSLDKRVVNTNGDSDSIACISGAISGAYLGVNAIPNSTLDRLSGRIYSIHIGQNGVMNKKEKTCLQQLSTYPILFFNK